MNRIKGIATLVIVALILGACSSSNHVVNTHSVSKRKYTKGLFIKKKTKLKSDELSTEEKDFFNGEPNVTAGPIESERIVKPSKVSIRSKSDLSGRELGIRSGDEVRTPLNRRSHNDRRKESSLSSSIGDMPQDVERETSELTAMTESEQVLPEHGQSENRGAAGNSDVELILLVILALIIPPLAVFLFEGVTTRFWIDLILAILGYGIGFGLLGGLHWGLLGLISVIYAVLIVLSVI